MAGKNRVRPKRTGSLGIRDVLRRCQTFDKHS
jgi:hypothetical protein